MTRDCPAQDGFASTPLQQHILDLLAGRALHTHELVRTVGNVQGFFSGRGGFWELRHLGLVVHDAVVGNYRPDMPPPGVIVKAPIRHPLEPSAGRGSRQPQVVHRVPGFVRGDASHGTVRLRAPHTPAASGRGSVDD